MYNPNLENPSRRRALVTGGGLAAIMATPVVALADTDRPDTPAKAAPGGGRALPEYAAWKNADVMIVHSANTIELRRDAFGQGSLTPNNRLFVRNNLTPPAANITDNPDAWAVEIAGVANPRSLTVAELKRLGIETVTMILQCSGNGRGYFPHKPSGTQWLEGAAGCVQFTGVPMKAVVEALGGVAAGMKYMTSTGGEELPEGLDPNMVRVERSVPADMLEHSLLAWELNGEPLPLAHGGPLRMIVPGYTGVNNIKYVKRVAFTEDQSPAKIQQTSYRFTPVGEKGHPDAPSLWEVPVNSWITGPMADGPVAAGRAQIIGLAFGGFHAVKGVEVSVDGGKTWVAAQWSGPDLGRFAWRNFVLEVDLKPGKYQIASRATNEQGDQQPRDRMENERGYNNNSWLDRSYELEVV